MTQVGQLGHLFRGRLSYNEQNDNTWLCESHRRVIFCSAFALGNRGAAAVGV